MTQREKTTKADALRAMREQKYQGYRAKAPKSKTPAVPPKKRRPK